MKKSLILALTVIMIAIYAGSSFAGQGCCPLSGKSKGSEQTGQATDEQNTGGQTQTEETDNN